MPLEPRQVAEFRDTVLGHYRESGRHDLPWRATRDPYEILVSEVMLQQTQVQRVLKRYDDFLSRFPTVDSLAAAPLAEVLDAWQGLGYHRRAVALKRAAEQIAERFGGQVPGDEADLRSLPGVGPATAAGVMSFAFGQPSVYIETNVRAVFLHHFFADAEGVSDRDIAPLVEQTLPADDPATWYYALMDYGVHLKRTLPNPSRRSRHHATQSRFEGSRRQKRARLLRAVLAAPGATADAIAAETGIEAGVADDILGELACEGFLARDGEGYSVG